MILAWIFNGKNLFTLVLKQVLKQILKLKHLLSIDKVFFSELYFGF